MEYKIIHEDAFPLVECKLQQGETLKAESDAMVSMTGNLDIRGSMDRNILGGLARRFLAGESFFFKQLQRLVDQEPYCLAMLHLVE